MLLLIVALTILLAPLAVSNGVRLWIWWFARQEGFVANIDHIDAPFLRPIVIRQLQLKTTRDDAVRVDVTAIDTRLTLNLKHILLHVSGRDIRNVSVRELRTELHRANPNVHALTDRGWATLHRLLPENLSVAKLETRVENGSSLILVRNASISASATESGRFTAAELMITSPWVRQTFSQLRGATHWENNRLTLAGLTLTRGLDLQSATVDLSRLGNQRLGLQFDVDAFGGKLRGNISHEWHSRYSNWKIAGGAADLSLAQIADALGFADRVNGLLHAGNFTFRGNMAEPDRATASLWCELTDLTWRERTAEAIMLGAALYNRKIEIQQLYGFYARDVDPGYGAALAQLDRFLFRLLFDNVDTQVLDQIISERRRGELPAPTWQMERAELETVFRTMDRIYLPRPVSRYIARLVSATHPGAPEATDAVTRYVSYGASPRAAIAIAEAARTNMPSSHEGFAVPLAISGQVVAVLWTCGSADSSAELPAARTYAIEILARHAARGHRLSAPRRRTPTQNR